MVHEPVTEVKLEPSDAIKVMPDNSSENSGIPLGLEGGFWATVPVATRSAGLRRRRRSRDFMVAGFDDQ